MAAIIKPQKCMLGCIFANFLFFFLSKKQICICINRPGCCRFCLLFPTIQYQNILSQHIRRGKKIREKGNLGGKSESTYKNTILMSNIGNYLHCQTFIQLFPAMLSLLVFTNHQYSIQKNIVSNRAVLGVTIVFKTSMTKCK